MRHQSRDLRDQVVRALARLSLVGVLALMGAVFVGSAAAVGGTQNGDSTSITDGQQTEQNQDGVLDDARPMGLMIGGLVICGGLVVLMIGAFKPDRQPESVELTELLRD